MCVVTSGALAASITGRSSTAELSECDSLTIDGGLAIGCESLTIDGGLSACDSFAYYLMLILNFWLGKSLF